MIKVRILGEAAVTRQNPDVGGTVAVPVGSPEAGKFSPSLKAKIGDIGDLSKYSDFEDPAMQWKPKIPTGLVKSILPLSKLAARIKQGDLKKVKQSPDFKKFDEMIQNFLNTYRAQEKTFLGDVPDWSNVKEAKDENYYLSILHNQIKVIGEKRPELKNAANSLNNFLNSEYPTYKYASTYVKRTDPSTRIRTSLEEKIKAIINQVLQEMKQENAK